MTYFLGFNHICRLSQRSAFQQASWSRYHGGIICIIRVEVSEFRSFYCNIRFWRFFYVSLEKRGVSFNITFCQIDLWTIFNEIDKNDINDQWIKIFYINYDSQKERTTAGLGDYWWMNVGFLNVSQKVFRMSQKRSFSRGHQKFVTNDEL